MEEVCFKKVWTGSGVNKGFGFVNKEFVNKEFVGEVFVVDMVYFDERFGFDESFVGLANKEFVDEVFVVVMDYFGDYFGESSSTRDQRRLDESGPGPAGRDQLRGLICR